MELTEKAKKAEEKAIAYEEKVEMAKKVIESAENKVYIAMKCKAAPRVLDIQEREVIRNMQEKKRTLVEKKTSLEKELTVLKKTLKTASKSQKSEIVEEITMIEITIVEIVTIIEEITITTYLIERPSRREKSRKLVKEETKIVGSLTRKLIRL